MGLLLISSPWIFGFANGGAETYIPVIAGIMVLLLSTLTDYEYGLIKKIPMAGHLSIDVLTGIFLAISPFIFMFSHEVYLPHVILGILEIGAGFFTQTTTSARRNIGTAPGI